MASVFLKRGKWWARIKGDKEPGKWSSVPTGETDREKALRYAAAAQKAIDKRRGTVAPNELTLRDWIKVWLPRRREAGQDWRKDRGRLERHILPELGGTALSAIAVAQVADLVHELRFEKKLAGRTVRNIYSVLAAAMRDASIAGKIQHSPCVLTEVQLGPIVDKDPEWRSGALFTREEAEAMISDPRIPLDRQLVYGFGLLAGLRPGEAAALRWRHYDATCEPLGRLTVATAYSTTYSKTKRTKTQAVRSVPVHPALAELLAAWRDSGLTPTGPDDLIIPLPAEVKRTKRTGERFRGWDYSGRKWRDVDLPALGWRPRSVYDTKSTFITLILEDGADRDVIRERVTHTKRRRDAFDGYDRGERWEQTCREVAKLRIRRRVTTMLPNRETPSSSDTYWLRRRVSKVQLGPQQQRPDRVHPVTYVISCDVWRARLVTSPCYHPANSNRSAA